LTTRSLTMHVWLGRQFERTARICSAIHPTVRIWPPQTTTCMSPWKITERLPLQGWRGSPESRASWLQRARTDFYCRGIFKIPQRWQKCIDRAGDSIE
jgi:hypothetical protein